MTSISAARSAAVAAATLTYTGQPTEDQTVTIGNVVYRFRASGNVAQAYDVLIDSTDDDTWTNFKNAVIAGTGGGTSGTSKYYNGGNYAAHPSVTAAINTGTGVVTLTTTSAGSVATSKTASNVTLATTASVTSYLGDIVAVLEVSEETPTMPSQQNTVTYYSTVNPNWPRNVRANDTAVAFMRSGSNSVQWLNSVLLGMSVLAEPSLAWSPPVMSTQPSDASVAAEGNTSFTVAVGTELTVSTYAWYRRKPADATGTQITGATTPDDSCTYGDYATTTLTITAADAGMDGYLYYCVITDSEGGAVTSAEATLTVT